MEQNYEIFYRAHRFVFEGIGFIPINIDLVVNTLDIKQIEHLLSYLKKENTPHTIYISKESNKKLFLSLFKKRLAGGGAVFNTENKLLLMSRLGVWDLPKGKLDKGETIEECALREVEEECNVKSLEIVRPLCETFHLFYRSRWQIKHTYWYEMKSEEWEGCKPQIEESIEAIRWVKLDSIDIEFLNTYNSIRQVLRKL